MIALLLAANYLDLRIEGWPVRVDRAFATSKPAMWRDVRLELSNQLYRITRAGPAPALVKLRQVTVWVHETSPETACMAYHPGAQWLREHKMNPAMERGVEIGNAANFVSWTHQQPWMLLHEMAHAYHDRELPGGFGNLDLKSAFDRAIGEKRYDSVLHWQGKQSRHYAASNPMEFFAEASEAYFGQNDFFPFVRAELKTSDPETFALVERLWGATAK